MANRFELCSYRICILFDERCQFSIDSRAQGTPSGAELAEKERRDCKERTCQDQLLRGNYS